MRPDVKLGVVTSLIVVVVAGGYFLYRDKQETPIPLAEAQPASKVETAERAPTDAPSRARKAAPGGPAKGEAAKARRTARNSKKASRSAVPSKARDGGKTRGTGGKIARKPASGRNPSVKTANRSDPVSRNAGSPGTGSGSAMESAGTTTAATPFKRSPTGPETARQGQGRPARHTSASNKEKVAGTRATLKRTDRAARRTSPKQGDAPTTSLSATSPSTRDHNAAVETHRTQPGDTLASLARQYYGDEKYTRFLTESNPHITDPNRLGVGALIKLPPAPPRVVPSKRTVERSVAATTARSSSQRSYTVRSGDSFYGIARDELGDATRWKELLKLNGALVDGDPKKLQVGQVIALPRT